MEGGYEEMYRKIAEILDAGIWHTDVDDRTVYVNDKMARMLGYSVEEMIGRTTFEFVHSSWAHMNEVHMKFRKERDNNIPEAALAKKDGSKLWVAMFTKTLYDHEGKFTGGLAVVTDITERKNTELALKYSEERYRGFINNAPAITYEIDCQSNKFISVNDVMCTILGYTREELLNTSPFDILCGESQAFFRERIKKLHMGEKPEAVEYKIKTKDGRELNVICHIALAYEDGVPNRVIVVAIDITERKRVEDELRASEGRLRTFMQQSVDGIIIIDRSGTIVEWNPGIELITGISRMEALGSPLWEMQYRLAPVRVDEREFYKAAKEKIMWGMLEGVSLKRVLEEEILRPDGERRVMQSKLFALYSEGKMFAGAVVRDVTERRRAEEALKQANERLNEAMNISENRAAQLDAIFDSMSDGLLMIDMEGNSLFENAIAIKLLGIYKRDKKKIWERTTVEKIVDDEGRPIMCDDVPSKKALRGEFIHNASLTVYHNDGSRYALSVSSAPIRTSKGKNAGIVITLSDVTAAKDAEREQLRLKALDRMRNDFLDIFAHELKTPLTPLKMYCSLMKDGRLGKFSSKDRKRLDDMVANVARLERLVAEMLDYMRVKVTSLEISPRARSLLMVVKDCASEFRQLAHVKGISIEIKNEGNTKGHFDAGMIGIAIKNLISNAVKYSNGGKVVISVKGVGDGIQVAVSDEGAGISKPNLKHLFEKYYTAETSLTCSSDQLGLGLYIAKAIVEQHGGRIWAKSKLGKGSTFSFVIPRMPKRI